MQTIISSTSAPLNSADAAAVEAARATLADAQHLAALADEADATGDYSAYDEARYNHYERAASHVEVLLGVIDQLTAPVTD